MLEIGTVWGGFALHAARHYGCHVTTTPISREQHAWARGRIDRAELADRITLLADDYCDLAGTFDKLISIEMIEAVGHQYFDTFFRRCSERLRPGGTMLLQAITIAYQRYEAARDSVDYINRHIFPGCCIPSITLFALARQPAAQCRSCARHGIRRRVSPHVGVLLRLLRGRFCRGCARRRADPVDPGGSGR